MQIIVAPRFSALAAACAVMACGLAGCGADDVQLNGKVFDVLGVSDNTKTKSGPVKVAERSPLVLPPSTASLPEPGTPTETASIGIQDHDAKSNLSQAEKERQQAEFCDKNADTSGANGLDPMDVEGPYGSCRKSVLSAVKNWNSAE